MPDEKTYRFHALSTTFRKDGIKRSISLGRDIEGSFHLVWQTWWAGDEKEPLRTVVRLSTEGLNATLALVAEFHRYPERFLEPEPITEPETEQA